MSFSSSILVTFRIWLNRLYGFQTLKLSDKFSKNRSHALARYYPLLPVGLIIIFESCQLNLNIQAYYRIFKPETAVAFVILSMTGAIGAMLGILSDSFIHATEKVNLYNNFQKINDFSSDEKFNVSTALGHTNSVFVILVTLKAFHSTFILWTFGWSMFTLYIMSRTFILSLMSLQILSEICTCESHIKCIRHQILWSNIPQLTAQDGIDFRATSFSSNGSEEEITPKEIDNSATKDQMNIYALINENLKLISNRFKYAVTIHCYVNPK